MTPSCVGTPVSGTWSETGNWRRARKRYANLSCRNNRSFGLEGLGDGSKGSFTKNYFTWGGCDGTPASRGHGGSAALWIGGFARRQWHGESGPRRVSDGIAKWLPRRASSPSSAH